MQTTIREKNQRLLLEHLGAENQHRLNETLDTLRHDCVFEDIALQRTFYGHNGAQEYYQLWWSAFSIRVEKSHGAHWVSDDLYIGEAEYSGTHVGGFLGIAATNRPIRFRFVVFVSFKDGKFSGERFYYDLASVLRQIGVQELPVL